MGNKLKDPQGGAQKWANNLGAATPTIIEGVNAVTESPTAKAADQKDRYLQGVQRAVTSGKWEAALRRVSTEDWKRAMLDKGVNRISQGATAAIPKMAAFNAEFYPYLEQGMRQLDATMPRGDINQNVQRAVQMIMHNAKFKRRGQS